jgi:hypothetical protein
VVVYNRNYDLHNGAVLEVLLKTGKLFSKRLSREPGLVNTILRVDSQLAALLEAFVYNYPEVSKSPKCELPVNNGYEIAFYLHDLKLNIVLRERINGKTGGKVILIIEQPEFLEEFTDFVEKYLRFCVIYNANKDKR